MSVTFTPSLNSLGFWEGQPVVVIGPDGQRHWFTVTGATASPSPKYTNRHEARKAAKLARRLTSE